MKPTRIINSKEFFKERCFIYGWYRNGKYLYIGTSTRGDVRLWTHQRIKIDRILPEDEFHFWDYENDHELRKHEDWLNCIHKPTYNTYIKNQF